MDAEERTFDNIEEYFAHLFPKATERARVAADTTGIYHIRDFPIPISSEYDVCIDAITNLTLP